MPMTKEEKAAYQKKYREKNKEKLAVKQKEYKKKWRENNCEKWKKSNTIGNWKKSGVVAEDFDSLYIHYQNATHCDFCKREFGEFRDGTNSWKCLDHCHKTGEFRNFLCNSCNIKRR